MVSLKELRIARGWTQQQLAERADLRRASISQIESGKQQKPKLATITKIAQALGISEDDCLQAIDVSLSTAAQTKRQTQFANETNEETALRSANWSFMSELDRDLASALARELIVLWTHSSTSIEGNTINIGDTREILTNGITVSGKSLLEHAEIHGHANAISLMSQISKHGHLKLSDMHELHQCIQTGVSRDIFSPIGKWKVERNGTQSRNAHGSYWHEYSAPHHVAELMDSWMDLFRQSVKTMRKKHSAAQYRKRGVTIYVQLHVAFTRIHPYADGNGRMARLLSNIPLLIAGLPPILINPQKRSAYIALLSEHDLSQGTLTPDKALIKQSASYKRIIEFCDQEWEETWSIVNAFRSQQHERENT